jgi:hypothetical protein
MTMMPRLSVVERWQTTITYTSLLDFSYFRGNISRVWWCMGAWVKAWTSRELSEWWETAQAEELSESWCCGSLISHSSWRDLCVAAWRFKSDLMVVLCCTFALAWWRRFHSMRIFLFLYSPTSPSAIRHDSWRLRISKTFLAGHSHRERRHQQSLTHSPPTAMMLSFSQ